MARILFVWELGQGLGHLAPYRAVVQRLQRAGHTVWFLARDLAGAERVFGEDRVACLQAPILTVPVQAPINPSYTFAQILYNVGFHSDQALLGRVRAWRELYRLLQPDLALFDHSPTALLAARGFPFAQVNTGLGFYTPRDENPMPNLRYWMRRDDKELVRDEEGVLRTANRVLKRLGAPGLDYLAQLFTVDRTLLLSFPEMDHYGARPGVDYLGVAPDGGFGEAPGWPPGEGPRVFVYLKVFRDLAAFLKHLAGVPLRAVLYCPELSGQALRQIEAPNLRFASQPINVSQAVRECDFAILNGGHSTTVAMLLAGKPVLLLPLHLEQYLVMRNVETLGAGIGAPMLQAAGMAAKLGRLMNESGFGAAARAFAAKHADFDSTAQARVMQGHLEGILANGEG